MDLIPILRMLESKRQKILQAIALLEELQVSGQGDSSAPDTNKKRGRKYMGKKERQEVSERMKKYWARRRKDTEVSK
jgi:hypothetical protein